MWNSLAVSSTFADNQVLDSNSKIIELEINIMYCSYKSDCVKLCVPSILLSALILNLIILN